MLLYHGKCRHTPMLYQYRRVGVDNGTCRSPVTLHEAWNFQYHGMMHMNLLVALFAGCVCFPRDFIICKARNEVSQEDPESGLRFSWLRMTHSAFRHYDAGKKRSSGDDLIVESGCHQITTDPASNTTTDGMRSCAVS